MLNRVVRTKVQVLLSVCRFSVNLQFHITYFVSNYQEVQKRELAFTFHLICELDAARITKLFKKSVSSSTDVFFTTSKMSSTYLCHSLGFSSTGAVSRIFRSRYSMYTFATNGETGPSIAVPNFLTADLSTEAEVCGCEYELQKFHHIIHFQ